MNESAKETPPRRIHPADLLFAGTLAFLIGVFIASSSGFFRFAGVIAGAFWLFSHFGRNRSLWVIFVFFAFLFLGAFYYHFYLNLKASGEIITYNEPGRFRGVVAGEPFVRDENQFVSFRLEAPNAGTITALLPRRSEIAYGDLLELRGTIVPRSEERSGENPISFFPEIIVLDHHRGSRIKEALIDTKLSFIGVARRLLPKDQGALLSGILFGYRGDFREEFRTAMAKSGTTHLVALSGYNIAIVALAIGSLTRRFLRRRQAFIMTTLAIVLFVLMTGAESSVVRAAIMGFLALLAQESGRRYNLRNAITLAAGVMAIFDPTILTSDVGFQLSFASLLGIVYLSPAMLQLWTRGNLKNTGFLDWRGNAATTSAAQLTVLPLLVRYFNEFSLTALAANILILSVIPITMLLGFIVLIIGALSYTLGFMFAHAVHILLSYETAVIYLFSKFSLTTGAMFRSEIFVIIYYIALMLVALRFNRSRAKN